MSLLVDLLSDVLAGALGPPTNKGLLLGSTVAGLALAIVSGWLAVSSPVDVSSPDWHIGVLVCSLLVGSAGAFLSILHLSREPQRGDRAVAVISLAVNLAAATLPIVPFIRIGG